jgi:hypothetical protein
MLSALMTNHRNKKNIEKLCGVNIPGNQLVASDKITDYHFVASLEDSQFVVSLCHLGRDLKVNISNNFNIFNDDIDTKKLE